MLRKIFFCSLFSICSLLSGKEVIDFGDSGHPLKFYASGKHFPVIASDGTPMRLFQAGKKYYEIRLREKKLYWKAPVFELDLKLDLPEKDSVKIVALHLEDADGELVIFNKELKKAGKGVSHLVWQFSSNIPQYCFEARKAKNKKLDFPIRIRGFGILFEPSAVEKQTGIRLGKLNMIRGDEETRSLAHSIFPALHYPDGLFFGMPTVRNAELVQREKDVFLHLRKGSSELVIPQGRGLRSFYSNMEKIRIRMECDRDHVALSPYLLKEKGGRIPLSQQMLRKGKHELVFSVPDKLHGEGKLKFGGFCFKSDEEASISIQEIELFIPQPFLQGIRVEKTEQKLGLILPETKQRRASIGFRNTMEEKADVEVQLSLRDHEKELRKETHLLHLLPGQTVRLYMPEMKKEGIYFLHYSLKQPGKADLRRGKISFAVMTPSGPAAPEENPFFFGIQMHAQRFSPFEQALAAEAYQLAGIRLIRNGAQWGSVQPKKGVWNFQELEGRIRRFRKRGVAFIGSLSATPKWAKRKDWVPYKAKNEVYFPHRWPGGYPPDHEAFREWAKGLASHFPNGTFPFYEMQNEPDHISFCNYSPEELAELQKIAAEEIRKIDPEAKIMTGGFMAVIPQVYFLEPKYMEKNLKAGKGFYDVIAIHCHGTFETYTPEIEYLLDMRKRLGIETIPWFPSETGIPSVNFSELEQAQTLFKKLIYSWANGAIGYMWYDFKNDGRNAWEAEHNFGIYTYDLEPKAGYPVYNALTRLLKRANFKKDHSDHQIFLYEFRDREKSYYPCWSNTVPVSADRPFWMLNSPEAQVADLFGNTESLENFHGAFLLQSEQIPRTFIVKNQYSPRFSPFLTDAEFHMQQGKTTVGFTLHNPLRVPIRGRIFPEKESPISFRDHSFEIPAGGKTPVSLLVRYDGNQMSGKIPLNFSLEGMKQRRIAVLPIKLYSRIPRTEEFRSKPDLRIDRASQMKRLTINAPGEHQLWRGAEDLSAALFLNHSEAALKVKVVVRDDVHCQTYRGRDVWRGDNVQLCLSLPGGKRFLEIGLTHLPNGKNEVCFWNAAPEMNRSNSIQLKTSRNEKEKTTSYEAVIPWNLIGYSRCPDHLSFNLLVNENDGRGRKLQGALSFPEKDIRSFRTLYFSK